MKKIAVGIAVVLGLTFLTPAEAEIKQSIVIIDTAVDMSLPILKEKVVYEVCLMEELRCPNKKSFMEGTGSATLPPSQAYYGGFAHGTQMSLIANKINPDMNIIFIRIFPMDKYGNVAYSSANANSTVKQALDSVIANKSKFNVVAVSASIGQRPTKTGLNYCSINKFDEGLKTSIKSFGILALVLS